MNSDYVEYNLPRGAYTSFDAITLKDYIKNRLTQNSIFTDQNFEGSNLSALTDVFAFAYHILLFYFNQTASEAMFDQSELYENMNKIVKMIDYRPAGPRTSIINFTATASPALPIGTYTIRRYSSIDYNGLMYSFVKDTIFEKTINGTEVLDGLSENNLLYQGEFVEYPIYTAIGEDFEIITIVNDGDTSRYIDYDNIDLYVKREGSETWVKWEETESIFFNKSNSNVYEKRVNENGRYEIKFGDNISGKRLNSGDLVSIFYLLSDGAAGIIDIGALQEASNITPYNTALFNEISNSIYIDENAVYIGEDISSESITFNNIAPSTGVTDFESVADIRKNAPRLFSSQKRAVTISDYESIVNSKFSNILQSATVVGNDKYLSGYINYFYKIGLARPNDNINILINQLKFADACDFNNIYIFAVPILGNIINEIDPAPMPLSQKQLIVDTLENYKTVTSEIIISDPVYTAFDLGVNIQTDSPRTLEEIQLGASIELLIDSKSRISAEEIKSLTNNAIVNYFKNSNNILGKLVNLSDLAGDILSIEGVDSISTKYVYEDRVFTVPGLSFVTWNPLYPEDDIEIVDRSITLPYFKFPYLYNASKFINKITTRRE